MLIELLPVGVCVHTLLSRITTSLPYHIISYPILSYHIPSLRRTCMPCYATLCSNLQCTVPYAYSRSAVIQSRVFFPKPIPASERDIASASHDPRLSAEYDTLPLHDHDDDDGDDGATRVEADSTCPSTRIAVSTSACNEKARSIIPFYADVGLYNSLSRSESRLILALICLSLSMSMSMSKSSSLSAPLLSSFFESSSCLSFMSGS